MNLFLQPEEKCVCDLVDTYLAALYPDYFESTRAVLLGQARDLLKNAFHADLFRFEREFLSPAAEIIRLIKNVSHNLTVSFFIYGLFWNIYRIYVFQMNLNLS